MDDNRGQTDDTDDAGQPVELTHEQLVSAQLQLLNAKVTFLLWIVGILAASFLLATLYSVYSVAKAQSASQQVLQRIQEIK